MSNDLLVAVALGVLGLLGRRRQELPGVLLVAAGSAIEIMADTVIMMAAGGTLVAVGVGLITGRHRPAIYLVFGSLFLFLIGASAVVTFARTDSLALLRVALGGMPPRIGRGALVTIWVALALRTAFLPASLPLCGSRVAVALIGPAWWSAAVLAARWGAVLPQDLLDRCVEPCSVLAVGVVVASGVWAFRATEWSRTMGSIAAGVGMLAALAGWFGGGVGAQGGRMAMLSTAVAGCALASAGSPAGVSGAVAGAVRMLLLGYPLGGGFTARLHLMAGCGGMHPAVGLALLAFWILPLAGSLRHTGWSETVGKIARWHVWFLLAIGLVGALEGGPLALGMLR